MMVTMVTQPAMSWVLLSYRIPREPSTPRIAVWRKLKAIGALQIGDGLVALPNDPRTLEHFEWLAESVLEADGEAIVWQATTTRRDSESMARRLRAERTAEFEELLAEVSGDSAPDERSIAKWRRELRRIDRRDYLRSPGHDEVRIAIADAATRKESPSSAEKATK